jgi:hypothetical protein
MADDPPTKPHDQVAHLSQLTAIAYLGSALRDLEYHTQAIRIVLDELLEQHDPDLHPPANDNRRW